MQLDQMPRHRQSQSKPALLPRNRTFRLPETIEHVRQKLCCDAVASIVDSQTRCRLNTLEIDVYAAATLREFDRIRQQVPDHLSQTVRISLHQTLSRLKACLKSYAFHICCRPQRFKCGPNDRREIEWVQIKPEIARNNSRHVEQVVNQSRLRTGVPLDRLDCARSIRTFNFAVPNHRGPTKDRSQRGAQLVREGGKKFILETIGFFGVPACIALPQQRGGSFFLGALARS